MHTPASRERVYLNGREGQYVVVWVDHDRRVADLIPVRGPGLMEEDVPFDLIYQVVEGSLVA